ncbi:Protein K07F5.12 [Aphelenchoides avenae]|nr:Protein K07F5.12 [Aphelenchus avenae]
MFSFVGLSAALGILHGLMMTPIVWVQDNDPNHSDNVLDYVFSHFSTVFAFSTLYFFAYAVFKRGRPYAPPELVLPSVAYGVLWSIGMTLWIVSNRLLSQTVSFPITARLPAIIGALTDVIVFRTIKGTRNLGVLFAGIAVGVTGVVLVALSNQTL